MHWFKYLGRRFHRLTERYYHIVYRLFCVLFSYLCSFCFSHKEASNFICFVNFMITIRLKIYTQLITIKMGWKLFSACSPYTLFNYMYVIGSVFECILTKGFGVFLSWISWVYRTLYTLVGCILHQSSKGFSFSGLVNLTRWLCNRIYPRMYPLLERSRWDWTKF